MHLGKKQRKISHLKSSTCEGGGGRSLKCQPISVFMEKKGNKNITNLIKVQRMFLATRHGQEAGPK